MLLAIWPAMRFLISAALLAGLVANFLWKLWWVDFVVALIILYFLTREAVEAFHNLRAVRQKSMLYSTKSARIHS